MSTFDQHGSPPREVLGLTCIAMAFARCFDPACPLFSAALLNRRVDYLAMGIACVSVPQGKFFQFSFELEALKGDFRGFLFGLRPRARMMNVNETMAPEHCRA